MLIERCNCTPSQAQEELIGNPRIVDVLHTLCYKDAYSAVMEWSKMDEKQRQRSTQPKGALVKTAERNRVAGIEQRQCERDEQLAAEGRA